MNHIRRSSLLAAALFLACAAGAYAYDPPPGGTIVPILPSAHALAYGPAVTASDAPWADWLNPAASAAQQRPVLEAGYVGLSDFGKDDQGWGSAADLGISLPKPYGVWGAGARFVSVPDSMSSLPLGSFLQLRGGIAKDLYPNLFVGAGLQFAFGDSGGTAWGGGLDLGFLHLPGKLGPFEDFRWGATLSGLGKGYAAEGASDYAFPPPYTLTIGGRGTVFSTADLRGGLGLELSAPSFADLEASLSASLTWRERLALRAAWDLSLRELSGDAEERSYIPSIGLTASIPIESKRADDALAKQGFDKAELKPALVLAPLYGDLWALGLGATLPLGTVDKTAPRIKASFPASAQGPAYISPNNDGVQDQLVIPLEIKDERYVVGWSFSVADAKGQVVRTIYNKESRPELEGFKGLWERLVYVKKGVPVPAEIVWNGVADSGQVVPDGEYAATIEAVDDNGNRRTVGPFPVVVDNTPPTASLSSPEGTIFSPDGDGNKETLPFKISGSVEDAWLGQVLDAAGVARRKVEYASSAPADFAWDGKDDAGKIIPDGVYSFSLAATDRAGNSVSRRLDGLVVNTQQPPIGLVIDLGAFSPNGDGSKDLVSLFPSVPVKTGLVSWTLAVLDGAKREVWSVSGKDAASLKDRFPFDGRDSATKALPEGQYQAQLSLTYLNGYSPKAASPSFLLDLSPPRGSASADRPAFNPAGDPGQNSVIFAQKGTKEAKWTGEIVGPDGAVLRRWSFSPLPDPQVEWDGTDESSKPLPDGAYSYVLRALDGAGNSFATAPVTVSLDTVKKAARLVADQKAFSVAAGSPRPRLGLGAEVKSNETVSYYELGIAAVEAAGLEPGTVVRSWKGSTGVPATFTWDGTTDAKAKAPDGRYAARLSVSYQNRDTASAQSPVFLLDSVAPSVTVSASPLLFSPSETSRSKVAKFLQKSVPGDDWEGRLKGPDGKVVRTWNWKGVAPDFIWEGTDEAGNLVPDGIYRYEVSSVDAAGNKGSGLVPAIEVDKRPVQVFVTASDSGLSPNGDGFKDDVAFKLIVKLREGIDTWRFAVVDRSGAERDVFEGKGNDVPERIVWEGRDASGAVIKGLVRGEFSVAYRKGDLAEARTGDILVSVDPPQAGIRLTPGVFSPDNDGVDDELAIDLDVRGLAEITEWKFEVLEQAVVEGAKPGAAAQTRTFASWGGSGAPAKTITWDGRSSKGELVESASDYPFVFTAKDALGNAVKVEGLVTVDVLVIREGDKLKIKVPSIVFRPNGPDFDGLDEETIQRNKRVVARIAQILNKFRDYRIGIVGHANSAAKIGGLSAAAIAKEESGELLALSLGRAELVKKLLAEDGVDIKRLSTEGAGSSQPVVDFSDAQNRWKNRRVEFILMKSAAPAAGR